MKWLHRLFGAGGQPGTDAPANARKVPCKKCGAMILPITARKNRGLCMPCATGARDQSRTRKIGESLPEMPEQAAIPKQSQTKTDLPGVELLNESITRHLGRLSNSVKADTTGRMNTIVSQLATELADNLMVIYAKVQQTAEDNRFHSWTIVAPQQLLLEVSVIPCSLRQGLSYFAKMSPPGYPEFLNYLLNATPAETARSCGLRVMANVVFGTDASVDMCIIPLTMTEEGGKACPCPVFPIDLLSFEECRRLGISSG